MNFPPRFWQLHLDFGDFSSGVCHVMRIITMVDCSPFVGVVTQQTFSVVPHVVARVNKMPITTMGWGCDLGFSYGGITVSVFEKWSALNAS